MLKQLSADTMFGNWQFFDLIVANNTFKTLLKEVPVFCSLMVYETVAKKIFTFSDAKLIKDLVTKMIKKHLETVITGKDRISHSDNIFLLYCVEILLKALDQLKSNKLGKRGIQVPFGLEIQQLFCNLVIDMVLPFFANQKTIRKLNYGIKSKYEEGKHYYFEVEETFNKDLDSDIAITDSFMSESSHNKADKHKNEMLEILNFKKTTRLYYKILKLFNMTSSIY